jgi:hypothetical protein
MDYLVVWSSDIAAISPANVGPLANPEKPAVSPVRLVKSGHWITTPGMSLPSKTICSRTAQGLKLAIGDGFVDVAGDIRCLV